MPTNLDQRLKNEDNLVNNGKHKGTVQSTFI